MSVAFSGRKNNGRVSSGFTLIELLVVVAIISLLVSILLPGLRSATDFAKDASCRSNLRQLGLLTVFYLDEYGGTFLHHTTADTGRPTMTAFANFAKDPSNPRGAVITEGGIRKWQVPVLDCPARTEPFLMEDGLGYGINSFFHQNTASTPNLNSTNWKGVPGKVTSPSSVYVFRDYGRSGLMAYWDATRFATYMINNPSYLNTITRHIKNARCNMLFLDGHVMQHAVRLEDDEFRPYSGYDDGK